MFQKGYLFLPCPTRLFDASVSCHITNKERINISGKRQSPRKEPAITPRAHLIMFVMNRINPFITHL
jgi:hypothetical protein